jgi:hypothetical protein
VAAQYPEKVRELRELDQQGWKPAKLVKEQIVKEQHIYIQKQWLNQTTLDQTVTRLSKCPITIVGGGGDQV